MYLLQKFDSDGFARLNSLIDALYGVLTDHVCLIASACYPFPEVLRAMSAPFDLVPFEGFTDVQYFPAERIVSEIEEYANQLLHTLAPIGGEYGSTLQPHSGTQANQIVYNAVLGEGDLVLSMSPSSGGHISHKVLVGGRNPVIHYTVGDNGLINYDQVEALARDNRPRLIIGGASSYPREIDFTRLGQIASSVGAFLHADLSHTMLFQISGHHRSVFPHVDFVSFSPVKNLRGPGGAILIFREAHRSMIARSVFPGTQGGPHVDSMFAKLVGLRCLEMIDRRVYGEAVLRNARKMCAVFGKRGITVVTKGTDTHMIMIDLREWKKTGVEVERVCESQNLLVNRNLVPGDRERPQVTSGIRLGTACITNLGATEAEAEEMAMAIADCIDEDFGCAADRVRSFRDRFQRNLVTPVWREDH